MREIRRAWFVVRSKDNVEIPHFNRRLWAMHWGAQSLAPGALWLCFGQEALGMLQSVPRIPRSIMFDVSLGAFGALSIRFQICLVFSCANTSIYILLSDFPLRTPRSK